VTPQFVPLELPGLRFDEKGVGIAEAVDHAMGSAVGTLQVGRLVAKELIVEDVPCFPEHAQATSFFLAGLGTRMADEPVGANARQVRCPQQRSAQEDDDKGAYNTHELLPE
jgi:hypothetical protein